MSFSSKVAQFADSSFKSADVLLSVSWSRGLVCPPPCDQAAQGGQDAPANIEEDAIGSQQPEEKVPEEPEEARPPTVSHDLQFKIQAICCQFVPVYRLLSVSPALRSGFGEVARAPGVIWWQRR